MISSLSRTNAALPLLQHGRQLGRDEAVRNTAQASKRRGRTDPPRTFDVRITVRSAGSAAVISRSSRTAPPAHLGHEIAGCVTRRAVAVERTCHARVRPVRRGTYNRCRSTSQPHRYAFAGAWRRRLGPKRARVLPPGLRSAMPVSSSLRSPSMACARRHHGGTAVVSSGWHHGQLCVSRTCAGPTWPQSASHGPIERGAAGPCGGARRVRLVLDCAGTASGLRMAASSPSGRHLRMLGIYNDRVCLRAWTCWRRRFGLSPHSRMASTPVCGYRRRRGAVGAHASRGR